MECKSLVLPPLTWTQFHALILNKYVPRTLRNSKQYEFMALEQGGIKWLLIRPSSMFCLDLLLNW